jgi:plasmid stabilization system protein ParE
MANVLKWTDRALEEYDRLVDYLYGEWGEEITQRVIKEIDEQVFGIHLNNSLFLLRAVKYTVV